MPKNRSLARKTLRVLLAYTLLLGFAMPVSLTQADSGAHVYLPSVSGGNSNVYYVAPDGNDANPGTWAKPWKTVQYAVDNVQPGSTIFLRAGTFAESVATHRSGQAVLPIRLSNYPGESATIDGGMNPAITDRSGTQYWTISGLTLTSAASRTLELNAWGCNGTCGGTHYWTVSANTIVGSVEVYGSYNVFTGNEIDGSKHKGDENGVFENFDASHHNAYVNNYIHDFNSRGIWSMHRTHDCLFENNRIERIGSAGTGMGIDTDGVGNVEWRHTIRGNQIRDAGYEGIELENTFASVVEDNVVQNSGIAGIRVINYGATIPSPGTQKCEAGGESNQYGDTDGDNDCEGNITGNIIRQNLLFDGMPAGGIVSSAAGGLQILGNTIYGAGRGAIWLGNGVQLCPEIQLRGNILAGNAEADVSLIDLASLTLDDHNLFFHADANAVYVLRTTWTSYSLSTYRMVTGKGNGSLQSDPLFVNPSQHDFHLGPGSPAIDASIDPGLPADLDGNPRPQGATYDIGPYEYTPYRQK
jgi:Right handed beta helix region